MEKKLFEVIKEKQSLLLARIEKGEIQTSSANGISTGNDEGISYEDAKSVIEHFAVYKKESRRFNQDPSKIVLSRRVFEKILSAPGSQVNMFLFAHLNEKSETDFDLYNDSPVTEKINKALQEDDGWVPRILFLFGAGFFAIALNYFLNNAYAKAAVAIAILIGLIVFAWQRSKISKAKGNWLVHTLLDQKGTMREQSAAALFSAGIDRPPSRIFANRFKIRFSSIREHINLVGEAIKLNGTVGYIVNKNVDISIFAKDKVATVTLGSRSKKIDIMPVILLKESIIIRASFLESDERCENESGAYGSIEDIFNDADLALLV
ncbi:MAG: hypothetical protein V4478_01625 [Patescibacteria group bacterium]